MPNDFDPGTGNDWDSPLAIDQMKLALSKQPALEPTQNYPFLGKVAQGLSWAANPTDAQGNAIPHKGFNPLDLLPLESTAKVLNQINYGEPMFQTPKANVPLSTQIPSAVDVGLAAAPLVGKAGSALLKAAGEGANARFLAGKSLIPGLGAEPQSSMFAVKPKGGNWLTQPTEWNVNRLKKDATGRPLEDASTFGYTPETNPQVDAINNWIDKKLTPYVRNEMGTKEDPVLKLAEERGVLHKRFNHNERLEDADTTFRRTGAGFSPSGYAKTPLGQQWEALSDSAINRASVGDIIDNYNIDLLSKKDPWLHRIDRDTPVNFLNDKFDRLGFQHVMDVLREGLATGEIHPEKDLPKISVADAVKRTHEYNEALEEAKRVKSLEDQANMTKVKEYKEGDKWVKLDKPGQFSAESDAMGHSVRGYEPHKNDPDWVKESGTSGYESYGLGGWNAIKEGRANVFSLRNPKGESKATIEARKFVDTDYKPERLPKDVNEQFRLDSEKEAVDAGYRPGSERFLNCVTGGEIEKRSKWFRENPQETYDITQIKGPSNGEIDPDHAWHVLDFLNSHPVGDVNVRDLENIYATDTKNKRQMRDFVNENYGGNMGMVDANQVLEHLELNYPKMPRFIHNTELGIMIDEAPAVRDKPEGYKDGGGVSAVESEPSAQFYSRTMENPDQSKTTETGIAKQFEEDYMRFAHQRTELPKRNDMPDQAAPAARTNIYGEYGTPVAGGMVSGRVTKMNDQPDTYMGDLNYRTNIGPGMATVSVTGMKTPQMTGLTNYHAGYGVPLGGNGFAGVNVMRPAEGGKPIFGAQLQYRKQFAKGGSVKKKPAYNVDEMRYALTRNK